MERTGAFHIQYFFIVAVIIVMGIRIADDYGVKFQPFGHIRRKKQDSLQLAYAVVSEHLKLQPGSKPGKQTAAVLLCLAQQADSLKALFPACFHLLNDSVQIRFAGIQSHDSHGIPASIKAFDHRLLRTSIFRPGLGGCLHGSLLSDRGLHPKIRIQKAQTESQNLIGTPKALIQLNQGRIFPLQHIAHLLIERNVFPLCESLVHVPQHRVLGAGKKKPKYLALEGIVILRLVNDHLTDVPVFMAAVYFQIKVQHGD